MINFFQKRREKKMALQAAGEAFAKDYPDKDFCGYIGRVKYNEPDRYVVEVCYGNSRPPGVVFYAVDKADGKVYKVNDKKYVRTYNR